MKTFSRLACLLASSIAGLVGCGGDGSSSTAINCSGGSLGSVPVDQLTSAQQTTVCSDAVSCAMSANDSVTATLDQLVCRFTGVTAAALSGATTDAALQQACQQVYDACIQRQDAGATTGQCTITTLAPTCTATVSQVFACINDELNTLVHDVNAALQSVPACASLTLTNLAGAADAGVPGASLLDVNPSTIASCQAVQTTCPGLFGTRTLGDAGTVGP